MAIDAFRTVVESVYFGVWYSSKAELLSPQVETFMEQPQILILPKLLTQELLMCGDMRIQFLD